MDFWLVLSKNDSNIIYSSIKNKSFLKIWRVWHILKVCHTPWYLKIEMGIAGSIFELWPPNFQKMCIFWRFTNIISTIFFYLLWFQFWKRMPKPSSPSYSSPWLWVEEEKENIEYFYLRLLLMSHLMWYCLHCWCQLLKKLQNLWFL